MGFTSAHFKRNKQTNNTVIKGMDKKIKIIVMYHFPIKKVLLFLKGF